VSISADWLIFHDQPVPRSHRYSVLGDQETRNGTHAIRTGTVPFYEHFGVIHQQLRAHVMLCGNR